MWTKPLTLSILISGCQCAVRCYEQFFFDDNASNDVWEDIHYDDVDDPTTPDIVGDIEILSETKSENHVSDNSNTTHENENNENETVETIPHNKIDTMNRSMNKEEVQQKYNNTLETYCIHIGYRKNLSVVSTTFSNI